MVKLLKDIEKIKKAKKRLRTAKNKGDAYEPDADGITIGNIKDYLLKRYKNRGYLIKSIKHYIKKDYFLINFNEKTLGPHTLESVKIDWRSAKREYEKQ